MKTILRTSAIIVAALVVVGLTIAFGTSALGQSLRARGPGGEHGGRERFEQHEGELRPGMFEGQRPEGFARDGQRPEGFPGEGGPRGEGGHGGHGPSLFGLTEVVKNLIKIGVVVALVVLGGRLLGWGKRDAPRRRPPTAGSAPPV